MIKNFFILFCFLTLGCKQKQLTALHSWEEFHKKTPSTEISFINRTPSSMNIQLCKDFTSNEAILDSLIEKYRHKKAQRLNLVPNQMYSELLSQFKRRSQDYIRPHESHVACTSVTCMYQTYYPNSTLAPKLAELWWLITDSVVAATDHVPTFGYLQSRPLLLFSEEDLKLLVESVLSADGIKYHSLSTFKVIYRIPEEAYSWSNFPTDTAAIASSSGYIIIRNLSRGTLIHEIAHHADYSTSGTKRYFGISETQEWRNFSGWYLFEEKDPNSGYIVSRKWQFKNENSFVREYAKTSPAEDWAESSAYHFTRPNQLFKVSDEKFNFVKTHFSSEKDYRNDALLNQINLEALKIIEGTLSKDLESCVSQTDKDLRDCFTDVTETSIINASNELRSKSPLLCKVFEKQNTSITNELRETLSSLIPQTDIAIKEFTRIASEKEALREKVQNIDLGPIYAECFSKEDGEKCYQTTFKNVLVEKIQDHSIPNTDSEQLILEFLENYDYDYARVQTISRYEKMYGNLEGSFKTFTESSWQSCNEVPLRKVFFDEETILSEQNHETYFHPQLIKCFSNQVDNHFVSFLNTLMGENFHVTSQFEGKLIVSIFKPELLNTLNELTLNERSAEAQLMTEFKESLLKSLPQKLIDDHSWIAQETTIAISCQGEAQKQIRQNSPLPAMEKISHLKFHLQGDYILNVSRDICQKVASDSKLKTLFLGSSTEQNLESFDFLRKAVLKHAETYIENCQLGALGNLLKRWELTNDRSACALKHSMDISKLAMKDWSDSPYGRKFSSDRQRLWKQLLSEITEILRSL